VALRDKVIDAIEGHDMMEDFCRPGLVDEVYKKPPILEDDRGTQIDRRADRSSLWAMFKQAGVAGVAERNHLELEENEELFSDTGS